MWLWVLCSQSCHCSLLLGIAVSILHRVSLDLGLFSQQGRQKMGQNQAMLLFSTLLSECFHSLHQQTSRTELQNWWATGHMWIFGERTVRECVLWDCRWRRAFQNYLLLRLSHEVVEQFLSLSIRWYLTNSRNFIKGARRNKFYPLPWEIPSVFA